MSSPMSPFAVGFGRPLEGFYPMKLYSLLFAVLLLSVPVIFCSSAAAQDAAAGPRAVPVVWDDIVAEWKVMEALPAPEKIDEAMMADLEQRSERVLALVDELILALPYGYQERAPIELAARRVRKEVHRYRNAAKAQVPGAIATERRLVHMELKGLRNSFPEGDQPELP